MKLGILEYYNMDNEVIDSSALFKNVPGLDLNHENEILSIGILFRLLLGTIKFESNKFSEPIIQTKNFFILGIKPSDLDNIGEVFDDLFETGNQEEFSNNLLIDLGPKIKNCFRDIKAEKNSSKIFNQLLYELSMYFFYCESSPALAFAYLYRSLEEIAYCFPLIYASKNDDFRGTFDMLKSFFTNNQQQELKFFQTFSEKLFENDTLVKSKIEICYASENGDETIAIEELFKDIRNKELKKNTSITIDDVSQTINFEHRDIFGFAITLRNRFFHGLMGGERNNFFSNQYDANDVFKNINPSLINMIAYTFKKIIET